MKKKTLRVIDKQIDSGNILLYYYHKLLLSLMKESDFTPDNQTLEIYCQLNPGYNILSGVSKDDMSVLTQLHKKQLEDFYNFSMINRTGEIIQNYTDKLFVFPKNVLENLDQYTSTLYLLKSLKPEDIEIPYLPRITTEGYDIVNRFTSALKKNIVIVDNQMGEIFDNLCFDMYSTFNIMTNTQMSSHKEDSLIEIEKEHYLIIIGWLLDHIEDSYSISGRDSGRFYQILMSFIWIHHVSELIGGTEFNTNKVHYRTERHQRSIDPLFYLSNPDAKLDNDWKWVGNYSFFQEHKRDYNRMTFYGNINQCNCICSKKGILPTKADKRTYDKTIVSFLTLQNYLYEKVKEDDECRREV